MAAQKTVVAAALLRKTPASPHGTVRVAQPSHQMLIARRTKPATLAGLWEFPGGKVEPGEDLLDALRRELHEELGIEVRAGQEIVAEAAEYVPEQGWRLNEKTSMRLFTAGLTAGCPLPLQDHDRLDWVDLDSHLLDYPWIPADMPIVRALLETCDAETSSPAASAAPDL